ncbi:uncharacterized protein LOC125842750 [Solanum stenotomum]|uniref:uncharacterized protein LOC125842750 n=1 Tax=Solanum stenotomum TaxID=172797 RepID=UPI0020D17EBF|nr:uncharacterized protein LOC125842750 [Solanum stenotomum]
MNPSEFLGLQVGEDPQNFIDEVKKIFGVMKVTGNDRVELASYQLKDVAHIWFTQWKKNKGENASLVTWECYTGAFLDTFFPRELREAKAQEFMNLWQGSMSVQEYGLKLTQLSRYAPYMVANSKARMSKFLLGESDMPESPVGGLSQARRLVRRSALCSLSSPFCIGHQPSRSCNFRRVNLLSRNGSAIHRLAISVANLVSSLGIGTLDL